MEAAMPHSSPLGRPLIAGTVAAIVLAACGSGVPRQRRPPGAVPAAARRHSIQAPMFLSWSSRSSDVLGNEVSAG